jgi:hypothetical protein
MAPQSETRSLAGVRPKVHDPGAAQRGVRGEGSGSRRHAAVASGSSWRSGVREARTARAEAMPSRLSARVRSSIRQSPASRCRGRRLPRASLPALRASHPEVRGPPGETSLVRSRRRPRTGVPAPEGPRGSWAWAFRALRSFRPGPASSGAGPAEWCPELCPDQTRSAFAPRERRGWCCFLIEYTVAPGCNT